MNHSYGQGDGDPYERSPVWDGIGYLLAVLAAVIALLAACALEPHRAHADGERDRPDREHVPVVIVKVEYVPVPSPLVSIDRLVFDALTVAAEAHDVHPGYLSCLVWKEAKFKPYAWVLDTNGRYSVGLAMLNEAGLQAQFYAWGYTDPMDPYQATDYLARKVAEGPATVRHNWFHAFNACA